MNWYLVKLVFQIIGEHVTKPQFDEQLRLIRADEVEWALEKARVLGWLEQTAFENNNPKRITWQFIDVADVHKLDNLEDGVQVCGTTVQPDCPEEYLKLVDLNRAKALDMLLHESTQLSES
ncbi:MAG: DUF4288 domain-containing protein [Cyclobacteriaceae bacterium]|nr:MAG: DUF4288 domain-containing protein [Cyclobacteriaceae bacterium]